MGCYQVMPAAHKGVLSTQAQGVIEAQWRSYRQIFVSSWERSCIFMQPSIGNSCEIMAERGVLEYDFI